MINSILNKLTGRKTVKTTSFFELSAKEQRKIVKNATREASIMQRDLVRRVQNKHRISGFEFSTISTTSK